MHARKWLSWLALGIWMWIPVSGLWAQDRTRQEVFDDMKLLKEDVLLGKEYAESVLINLLREFDFGATGEVSDSMRLFVEAAADNESLNPRIRQAAVSALCRFPQGYELTRVRGFMSDNAVKVHAAGVLVEWGYWDEASSILIDHEAWRPLLKGPPSLVEPILRDAASGSKTVLGRVYAGMALSHYGDTLTVFQTARAVLREYLVEHKACTDTLDLRRAVDVSCELLHDKAEAGDVQLYEAGLLYPHSDIRHMAVYALADLAWAGHSAAQEVLETAARTSPYPDVIETLGRSLKELKAKERMQR